MVPEPPPEPDPPPQAARVTAATALVRPIASLRPRRPMLRRMVTPSLDPAEADGVDDPLGEEAEQHEHGQGCDEGGRHQPRPVRAGLRCLRLEDPEGDGEDPRAVR